MDATARHRTPSEHSESKEVEELMTMMGCGHAANATSNGKPACVICYGIDPLSDIVVAAPDLSNRMAKCSYRHVNVPKGRGYSAPVMEPIPSSPTLAFFEYKGEGSRSALDMCAKCSKAKAPHVPIMEAGTRWERPGITDHTFEPHGAYEYDEYYCGCFGWD